MKNNNPYDDFVDRLEVLIRERPLLIKTTLSNIFTMRLIGNKTHGDLAEIGLVASERGHLTALGRSRPTSIVLEAI